MCCVSGILSRFCIFVKVFSFRMPVSVYLPMIYFSYFVVAVLLFLLTTLAYRLLSRGLSRSAKGQQLTRYSLGSLIAMASLAVAGVRLSDLSVGIFLIAVVSLLWMLTFPLLDFLSSRKDSADIDNRMDFAFGLYLFGFLTSAYLVLMSLFPGWSGMVASFFAFVEIPFLFVCVSQMAFFAIYGRSVSHGSLNLVLNTNVNEVIEFFKAFPVWMTLVGFVAAVLFLILWFFWNIAYAFTAVSLNWIQVFVEILLFAFVGSLMFKGRRAAFSRSGVPAIYFENIAYSQQLQAYSARHAARIGELVVSSPLFSGGNKHGRGRTFILVIGESASRDYIEAFAPTAENKGTSPWLCSMAGQSDRVFLFPNAYSCHIQTVPTLERALTTMSQYNSLDFVDALSLVELAQALGMKVYWFSNQGHVGQNNTPVTLVAETSEHAEWTSQWLNHQPYDEELLAGFAKVDKDGDKLIVFHLKGSHFTYSNRYPADREFFPTEGGSDYVAAYRNTLRYTDEVLGAIYSYAAENLNLQAMVYCSDHADVPDHRRSPDFDGFAQVRIPLVVFLSERYALENPEIVGSLGKNLRRPFSNDLLFNLMAGLWRVESPAIDPAFSLASDAYKMTPETTFVNINSLSVDKDPNFLKDEADEPFEG